MKKRVACLLLTLVMLLSLIPTAAITASAASNLHVSEAGIKVIKNYIGFHKNAYETYSGSGVYKIGYGTAAVKGQTITEANADKLLRDALAGIDSTVNAAVGSATLVQKQHDALVWYTYAEGKFPSGTAFVNAITSHATGSALADAFCSWDYDVSGYSDTDAARAVLSRRMAMLNLYVNGAYGTASTGSFAYTVFDAGEGAAFANGARKMVQVYDTGAMTEINVGTPSFGSSSFLGWYSDGALVTGVGSATAGKTLSAHWQKTEDKVSANYTLPAYVIYEAAGIGSSSFVIVRKQPSASAAQVDVVKRDATVTVVAEKIVGTEKWLELSTGGWVKLCNVGDVLPTVVPGVTVTITDDYVNVRENPSVTSKKVGTATRGETRTIVMTADGDKWGYCSQGWIFLAYTNYSDKTSSNGALLGSGTSATVTGASSVNVRTAAGIRNDIAARLPEGTAITVYEQTEVDGAAWGHIDQGWIYMGYVTVKQATQSGESGSNASTGSTVYVSSTVSLNVRSGPGTGYTKIGALNPGASVVILQKQVTDGVTWGLTDQGWINLNYVSTSAPSGTGSSAYGVGGTVVNCATGVNIRSAAGTNNALVGVALLGTRVTVTERVQVNGFYWGHIDKGWVCLDYVQLDSQWVDQAVSNNNNQVDNVVTTFSGYPAVTKAVTELRETASSDAKSLMTLNSNVEISILARSIVGEKQFGKVAVGNTTGWVDMANVQLLQVNAKVTAAKADTYEEPSVRSKFYASLVQGTYVTVGNGDGTGWQISDGILWGQTSVEVGGVTYSAWLKMSDVTMFKGNELPTGITTLNGVGYLTGTVRADSVVYKDSNGNVTTEATDYTLVSGHRVDILARNYKSGTTWAKVSVGAVTGWFQLTGSNLTLNPVTVQATSEIRAWTSAPATASDATNAVIPMGAKLTIVSRVLVPDSNEVNYGITDVGQVYVGDNHDIYYWVVLDDGRLNYVSAASNTSTAAPSVVSSVVITGTASSGLSVYEEAVAGSRELLKLSSSANVTILNWKNVGGITWGKVQIGNIVGWVKTSEVSFSSLTGTVAVTELNVYNTADKSSSVQILRVNDREITFLEGPVFDGTTVWGRIAVADKNGWVDLADLRLSTPGASYAPELVIATGSINSVNATINVSDAPAGSDGMVTTLPKGTSVNLTKVEVSGGEAWWLADLGDKDGWIKMDCLNMNTSVARITESSASIFDDLVTAPGGGKVLYTLYRGETITVLNFKTQSGALYGEVAYNNTTGWILICDAANVMRVSLTPGSTGSTAGSGSATPSDPTTTDPTTSTEASFVPGYIVCANTVNVRSGGGMEYPIVTTLRNETTIRIYEQTTVLGKGWAHIDEGWVCMDYVELGTPPTTVPTASGSISIMTSVPSGAIAVGFANEDVKIRSGSGMGYPEVGSVKKGNSLVIYENKLDGGMSWGRTDNGWICVSYLTITGIGTSPNATVSCSYTANVRSNSNSGSALMAKVMVTSRVAVYETAAVGNENWVRTDLGWINSQYVVMDAAAGGTPDGTTSSNTIIVDSGATEVG